MTLTNLVINYFNRYNSAEQLPLYTSLTDKYTYIRHSLPYHANILWDELPAAIFREITGKVFSTGLEIVSSGGGPATEIIGLLKKLNTEIVADDDNNGSNVTVNVKLLSLDIENWQLVWDNWMKMHIHKIKPNANFDVKFLNHDICSSGWTDQNEFKTADIFLFSYIMSEVFKRNEEEKLNAISYIINLANNAKSGALFFYIDVLGESNDWFHVIMNQVALKCNLANVQTEAEGKKASYSLALDEQKIDMGKHFSEDYHPKIQRDYCLLVFKKG